jgi:hypothetical protein
VKDSPPIDDPRRHAHLLEHRDQVDRVLVHAHGRIISLAYFD